MEPLVSIIIPVYNTPRDYLQEALDSVINQSYQNLEIIVVDDGSTSDLDNIYEKYKSDERVKVIHQLNHGLSAARNKGLDMMKGEFVAFLDSDDAFHPDIIKNMVSIIDREDIDIVVGSFVKCYTKLPLRQLNKGKALILRDELIDSTEALTRLADERINHAVWNKLYRTKLWTNRRFPEGYVSEDVFTTYKIINDSNLIMILSDLAVYYRVRHGSISDTKSYKNVNDWLAAWAEWELFVSNNTPVVFSLEQLNRLQERITYESVFQWSRIPIRDISHAVRVRKQILNRTKRLYSNNWLLKTQFLILMLKCFPCILRIIVPIYRFFRSDFFGT